ncbi:MAG TPA: ThiF family adenylyltransferase [Streptosporangiaceae bacterium]|nr:ThiF family adenylyltransferase [Streptosporangiaceae bacterium]
MDAVTRTVEPRLLQLRPTAHRVLIGGRLLLTHNERREAIEPYGQRESWLLALLASGIDAAELEARVRESWSDDAGQIHEMLGRLIEADIVRVLPPAPAVPERYERTLAYLSQFAANGGGEYDLLERLRKSAVVVAGVGGLGSWIAAGLGCLGVGQLRLVDCDVVEESNLNRSLLFREADIGAPKVAALAQQLAEHTSLTQVQVFTHDLASDLLPAGVLADASVVISTADKPAWVIRANIARACITRGLPFICPSGFRVGPFYLGPGTACVMCEHAEILDRRPELAAVFESQDRIPASQPGSAPHVAAAAAAVVLQDTLRVITGIAAPATSNHIWIADSNLQASRTDRPPYAGCQFCADANLRTDTCD